MNAHDKAMSLLKIRPHYSRELAQKLLIRGFDRAEVAEVINRLIESEMLNDTQFLQVFVENLIRFKTFGFYGLKVKLLQRGVASNEAESLLKEKLSLEQEIEIAQRVVNKEKNGDRMKLVQKLQRKGFRSEVIMTVISKKE